MSAGTGHHFCVDAEGANYEIYVQAGFIHVRACYFQGGERVLEDFKGTELDVTYETDSEGQDKEAILKMEDLERYPSCTVEVRIPAMWPELMSPPGRVYNQLPSLQAFFENNRMLCKTQISARNTRVKDCARTDTYTVCEPLRGLSSAYLVQLQGA